MSLRLSGEGASLQQRELTHDLPYPGPAGGSIQRMVSRGDRLLSL